VGVMVQNKVALFVKYFSPCSAQVLIGAFLCFSEAFDVQLPYIAWCLFSTFYLSPVLSVAVWRKSRDGGVIVLIFVLFFIL